MSESRSTLQVISYPACADRVRRRRSRGRAGCDQGSETVHEYPDLHVLGTPLQSVGDGRRVVVIVEDIGPDIDRALGALDRVDEPGKELVAVDQEANRSS